MFKLFNFKLFNFSIKNLVKTLAFLLAFVVFVNVYMINFSSRYIKTEKDIKSGFDCIVVLGAGVYNNTTPSLMLKERLDTAEKLYKSGISDKIIVSGDHGTKEYDEVNVMKSYLQKKGVPSQNIFMDHAGFSTYDTMYRAKEIFCVKNCVVVTQKYHLFRTLYIANKLGLDTVGICCDTTTYKGQSIRSTREAAARFKDFFYVHFGQKPTFLGDTIPVSGNGDITNDK